jgi:hypothetical protein
MTSATDYAAAAVRTLCPSAEELSSRWADAEQRNEIIQTLVERGDRTGLGAFKPSLFHQNLDIEKLRPETLGNNLPMGAKSLQFSALETDRSAAKPRKH